MVLLNMLGDKHYDDLIEIGSTIATQCPIVGYFNCTLSTSENVRGYFKRRP